MCLQVLDKICRINVKKRKLSHNKRTETLAVWSWIEFFLNSTNLYVEILFFKSNCTTGQSRPKSYTILIIAFLRSGFLKILMEMPITAVSNFYQSKPLQEKVGNSSNFCRTRELGVVLMRNAKKLWLIIMLLPQNVANTWLFHCAIVFYMSSLKRNSNWPFWPL